jgi:hypothetical protein
MNLPDPVRADPSLSLENMLAAVQDPGGMAELQRLRKSLIEGRADLIRIHEGQMAVIDELLARFAVVLDGGVRV